MKADFYKNLTSWLPLVVVLLLCCSCTEPNEESYADTPFKTLQVTVDGETVVAKRVDAKNMALTFDVAENFDDSQIVMELNAGYSVIFPIDVNHADLDAYPVLNFKAPDRRIVKVWLMISSKAFPIVDATKILADGKGGCVNVTGKTITILYDRTMNRKAIPLTFGEGALMEGGALAGETTFDFSGGGNKQLAITLDGRERIYNVKIDYTRVMSKPLLYGFSEITKDFVDAVAQPYINIFRSSKIPGVPIRGTATSETPWEWEHGNPDEYCAFIGNWGPTRATEIVENIDFVYATIDIDKAQGSIVSNDAHSITMADVNGMIAMSGNSLREATVIQYNRKIVSDKNSEGAWRATMGFYEDGHMEFWNAGPRDGKMVKMTQWNDAPVDDSYFASGTEWDVVSAASGHPWLVREGRLLTRLEAYNNDTGWGTALGEAWNGNERTRCYIGLTYDNKIGVAAMSNGLGTCQGAWVLNRLGWKDVFYVGGSYYLDNDFAPTIKVNGKVVIGSDAQATQYGIVLNVKQ